MFNLFADTPDMHAKDAKDADRAEHSRVEPAWAPLVFVPTLSASLAPVHSFGQPLPVARSPEIDDLLSQNAVAAISISGGKDSVAVAIATVAYLDKIGHTGPRVLIHADLGVVEWKDSLPCCERLAQKLGIELMVVRKASGDMMDRWEGRWRNNLARYADLSCVKLILPWSTPSMRFCTSELKAQIISSALRKRFPDNNIVSVTGIRRQESSARAKMPVSSIDAKLTRKHAIGMVWNAIIDWPVEQVFKTITDTGLALHEAYTKFKSSRVSCVFCIMASAKDLIASASCEDNHEVFRRMVRLEASSSFAFQSGKWLGDTAPHLLSAELFEQLRDAKQISQMRQDIEITIPKHLLFTKGWPTSMPTLAEAQLLADVRIKVAALLGIQIGYSTPDSILERYAQLIALKAIKDASKASAKPGASKAVSGNVSEDLSSDLPNEESADQNG